MECPSCGYAPANGHAPLCLWGHTVEAPIAVDTRETSREAYASIAGDLPNLESVVLDYIRRSGGATDDEIEVGTGLSHQCASARRNALAKKWRVAVLRDSCGNPVKRKTRSGRSAFVWVAA